MRRFSCIILILWAFALAADVVFDFGKPAPELAGYTRAWAHHIVERELRDGALHGVATGHPAYFTPSMVNLPLDRAQLLVVEMMAEPGADSLQVYANSRRPSCSYALKKLKTDGAYHYYCFEFDKMPKVKSAKTLADFRINPVTAKGPTRKAFAIRSIRLMPRCQHLPGVTAVIPKAPKKLVVPSFFQLPNGGKAAAATRLELSYDREALLIDFESAISNVSYKADGAKDGAVYNDDCFDITLAVTPDCYYQVAFNPAGTVFDQKVTLTKFLPENVKPNGNYGRGDVSWDSHAQVRCDIQPGQWSGSVAIPWRALGLNAPPPGMDFNIARVSKADSKGMSGWNYSPILSFALPDNLRRVRLGDEPTATVSADTAPTVLPGKNSARFHNPDRHELVCAVAVRDLATGLAKTFSARGKDAEIAVEYALDEGEYELLLTVAEQDKMIYFDARTVHTAQFRSRLQQAYAAVRRWPDDAGSAELRQRLLQQGKDLLESRDYAAIHRYISEVEKANIELNLNRLYRATLRNFHRDKLPFAVAAASSADKIFHSLDAAVPPFAGRAAAALEIATARREVEGTQLVLVGMDAPVRDLTFKISSKPAGKAPEIKLYGVDFLDTRLMIETKYKADYRGEWPEVLANDLPRKLAPREVRSVWINAETAADVPAGVYRYTLEVAAAGMEQALTIPLTVTVWNFTLPAVPTLRTAISNYDRFLHGYYAKFLGRKFTEAEKLAMTDTLARFMLKHRINPGHLYTMRTYGKTWIDFPALDRLDEYRALGLNALSVSNVPPASYSGTAQEMMKKYYSEEKVANLLEMLTQYSRIAEKHGLKGKFYLHVFDEIFAHAHKDDKIVELKKLAKRIKAAAPDIKLECITEVLPELVGVIDIWCPSIRMMAANPESYWARQKAGDELWLYTCLGEPGRDSGREPSFVLEESAAAMRLIGWICYFYRAEGFLYYSISNWTRNGNPGEKPYPETPWNMQNVNAYNGEACLLYPARRFDLEPLSSIRLENLRDGFEDYEYLKLLAGLAAAKREKLSEQEAREIADLLAMKKLVRSGMDYTDDSAAIAAQRAKIARWIEKLK